METNVVNSVVGMSVVGGSVVGHGMAFRSWNNIKKIYNYIFCAKLLFVSSAGKVYSCRSKIKLME